MEANENRITRRTAIRNGAATVAGVAAVGVGGAGKASAASAATAATAAPSRIVTDMPEIFGGSNQDLALAIRNWFANRCPLFTRLPWAPSAGTPCVTFRQPLSRSHVGSDDLPKLSEIADESAWRLTRFVESIERSIYYGVTIGLSRKIPKLPGRGLGVGLIESTVHHIRSRGGQANLAIVSPSLMAYGAGGILYTWLELRPIEMGETLFGTPIEGYKSMAIADLTVVESPLLERHETFVLSSSDLHVLTETPPTWRPTADDGEYVAALSTRVGDVANHAMIIY